ncbi:hypothetical protein ABFP43_35995, partial [Burkholderia sp. RS02]
MKHFLAFLFRSLFSRRQKYVRPSRLLVALFSRAVLATGMLMSGNACAVGVGTPVGNDVVIARPNAAQTIITQSSERAVINWDNFNIAPGELVRFDQRQGANSATLNQVASPDPT